MRSDSSLACHTYCDTIHPFIMVTLDDSWPSHRLPSVFHWSCHTGCNDSGLQRLVFEHPTFKNPNYRMLGARFHGLHNCRSPCLHVIVKTNREIWICYKSIIYSNKWIAFMNWKQYQGLRWVEGGGWHKFGMVSFVY